MLMQFSSEVCQPLSVNVQTYKLSFIVIVLKNMMRNVENYNRAVPVSFILPKNWRGHKGVVPKSMRIKNEMWQRLRFIHHYISLVI